MNDNPIGMALIFIAVMVLATLFIFDTTPPAAKVTHKNFGRIESGMTVKEVGEILGDGTIDESADNYTILKYINQTTRKKGDDYIAVSIVFIDGIVCQKNLVHCATTPKGVWYE